MPRESRHMQDSESDSVDRIYDAFDKVIIVFSS